MLDYSLTLNSLFQALYETPGGPERNPYTDGRYVFALKDKLPKKGNEWLEKIDLDKKDDNKDTKDLKTRIVFASDDEYQKLCEQCYKSSIRASGSNPSNQGTFWIFHLAGWKSWHGELKNELTHLFNDKRNSTIRDELIEDLGRWEYYRDGEKLCFHDKQNTVPPPRDKETKNIAELIVERNYHLVKTYADNEVLYSVIKNFVKNMCEAEEKRKNDGKRSFYSETESGQAFGNLKDCLKNILGEYDELQKKLKEEGKENRKEKEKRYKLLACALTWLIIGAALRDRLTSTLLAMNLPRYFPEEAPGTDKPGIAEENPTKTNSDKTASVAVPTERADEDHIIEKIQFTNKNRVTPFTRENSNAAQGGTYVQRDDLLGKIEACFETQTGKKRMVFLTGMGGSGKSELARAYAYIHNEDYEEIFWLTCSDGVSPELMSLIEKADKLNEVNKEDINGFSDKVLLIVDNCNSEDGRFLFDLEKSTGDADILVTTRLSRIGNYESLVPVESEEPEEFSYSVFEKNYCKKTRWGKSREIKENEIDSIHTICREVQYNTMLVSLIAIRLRSYNDLSIHDCVEKIRSGVSKISGKVIYTKDLTNRSEEIREILYFLFSDILSHQFTDAEKAILTVLSLTPASWYDMDYIISLCRGVQRDTRYEEAVWTLLDLGWVQGDGVSMALHPLIVDVLSSKLIVVRESSFFERLVNNYLGMPDEYLGKERLLIDIILRLAETLPPKNRLASLILINHWGYRKYFDVIYPEVNAAYFMYVIHEGKRYFFYHDMEKEETCLLIEMPCQIYEGKKIELLKAYNKAVPCKLNLQVYIFGKVIEEVPAGMSYQDSYLSGCLFPEGLKTIGDRAFLGCTGLSGELHLPESLMSIGIMAFDHCSGLSGELHLPKCLMKIGSCAFYNCNGLSGKLHIPEGLTNIEGMTFYGCEGLSGELQLPENLTNIGNMAFEGCSGLSGKLHLPKKLTSIGDWAFYGCSSLFGELHLPEGLKSIGKGAFQGCGGLSGKLHLPGGLQKILDDTFHDCSGLSGELNLPKSLTSIGDSAFWNCSGISMVHLPEGLTRIGIGAFYGCSGLSGELQLPGGLLSIGKDAFRGCSGLSGELRLPEGLAGIGVSAFYGCSGLSGELHLPKSLTRIGGNAFYGCSGLSVDYHELWIIPGAYNAFEWRSDLKGKINLPKGSHIGWDAFLGCGGLSDELYLPESLTSIEDGAFWDRSDLKGKIILPKGVTRIGMGAFLGCSSLSGELHLPEGLTSIGKGAFYNCSGLSGGVQLPESLTSIGDMAFLGCSGFGGELHLPGSLTYIGEYLFCDCSGLSGELHLPESLMSIGKGAFFGCSGLSGELNLPKSLTSIGDSAFWNCSGISMVHLPEGLLSIGKSAFSDCNGLSGELHLPESLLSIGDRAFSGCRGLYGVLLMPAGLKCIGTDVLSGCDAIEKIIFYNMNTEIKGPLNRYSSTIICGYRDSTAEKYANEYGLIFEEM